MKNLLKELRCLSVTSLETTVLWNALKYDEYLPKDSKYLRDRNQDKRVEIVELIGDTLLKNDVYILRKLADFEIEYTDKQNYHNCLAEIVFYLYELGNKEDVIYAYSVKNSHNMDASCASNYATLTMRTSKKEMMSYLEEEVKKNSDFLTKYPYILSDTEEAYDFKDYDTEENFINDFAAYYGRDIRCIK